LKSGKESISTTDKHSVEFSAQELNQGYAYRIIAFNSLADLNKESLEKDGITLMNYLPKNSFYARISTSINVLNHKNIAAIVPIKQKWKQTPEIYADFIPDYATVGNGSGYMLQLSIFSGEKKTVKENLFSLNEASIIDESINTLTVIIPSNKLDEIKSYDEVYFISAAPGKMVPLNRPGKSSHGSSYLDGYNDNGIHYSGEGISLMMTDDGLLNGHLDHKNRFDQSYCVNCSGSINDAHGDHVAGTIMGAGNINPYAKGMATGINFFVENGYSLDAFYTTAPTLYANDSLVVTSTSMGIPCEGGSGGGAYGGMSSDLDEQFNLLPNLLSAVSAGNNGQDTCQFGVAEWGNVASGLQSTKNGLTVGALNSLDIIAPFSSRGPLLDGRIKPDICGVGVGVYSTVPGNDYESWQGTSMSCPGVSGTTAQLYEAYKDHNNGSYPTAALMKAIILNSANDLGNKGPDFIHGFGKINGRKAFKTIENETYFSDTISTSQNQSFTINVPINVNEFRVMLYWSDPEGNPSSSLALVNDLDLTISTPNSTTVLPWVLDHTPDPVLLSAPAVPGIDTVNNVEQITIDAPAPGNYQININGTSVPMGPQVYNVVYEFNYDEIHVNYPNGQEGFDSPSNVMIRWDAVTGANDFLVEYTEDDGGTWLQLLQQKEDITGTFPQE
jgi:subtilisin family serine protease